MKIDFEQRDEKILFKVSDFDPKFDTVLQKSFYLREGDCYYKDFPPDYRYMEQVKRYYQDNLEKMLMQQGYFAEVPWEKGLEAFILGVEGNGIDWWLTGSCAACVRGISFNPHDIDIMVNPRDVEKVADIFSDYIIEPIVDSGGWVIKTMGVLFLEVAIDIASGPDPCLDEPIAVDCGPYAEKHLEEIVWRSHSIKIPQVELQLNVNRKRKRFERAKLIERYIKGKQK